MRIRSCSLTGSRAYGEKSLLVLATISCLGLGVFQAVSHQKNIGQRVLSQGEMGCVIGGSCLTVNQYGVVSDLIKPVMIPHLWIIKNSSGTIIADSNTPNGWDVKNPRVGTGLAVDVKPASSGNFKLSYQYTSTQGLNDVSFCVN